MDTRERIKEARRIVVKVGTSTLTYPTGKLNFFRIEKLVREISDLKNQGKEILLVTSAAIGAGMDRMGLKERPATIPEKQALAAVGQGILMHTYEKLFSEYGQVAAQVLLTRENSVKHKQYINCRNALLTLLTMGVIPVVNENDAVAVDELKIGDNDTLSAIVATLVDADLLVILSDIEGLYTANPQCDPAARLLTEIGKITPEIEAAAGGAGSKFGTGGMHTKIQAARIAVSSGVAMVIASGAREGVLREILAGGSVGTLFAAKEAHLKLKKSWLAFGARIAGDLHVDHGCETALRHEGSSLLAVGVTAIDGAFSAGDTVRILSEHGWEIARGMVNFNCRDLEQFIGKTTQEIKSLFGDEIADEVVHRDHMILMI